MLNRLNNEKGITQIIVVLAMTALLGAAAIAIDVGAAMAHRIKLSNAVDAATLAGAMELPTNPSTAKSKAAEFIELNGIDISNVSISVGDNNKSLTVKAAKPFQFMLAPVIGIEETVLNASAKVIIGPAGSAKGLRPFGVDEEQDLEYNTPVTLKEGAGEGETGNFGYVDLGDELAQGETGGGTFAVNINIEHGYDGTLSIGDVIQTETGVKMPAIKAIQSLLDSSPAETFDNYQAGSQRVWIIPIIRISEYTGTVDVTIVGFASFFIEDVKYVDSKTEITGRFIEYTSNGEIDETAPDNGFYGMKLTTP